MSRIPPQNLEAEQSLLGSLMIDSSVYDDIVDSENPITEADFYSPNHRTIYRHIVQLIESQSPVDILTVQESLRASQELDGVGGTDYLMLLVDSVPSAKNACYYAKVVRDKSIRRQWIAHCASVMEAAYNEQTPLSDVASMAHEGDMAISAKQERGVWLPFSEILEETFERIETAYNTKTPIVGIPSGIPNLDQLTAGWNSPDLIILAARPSQGKTALAMQWAEHAAGQGHPVGIFSCEMGRHQIALRSLQAAIGTSGYALRNPRILDEDTWVALARATGRLADLPIYINDIGVLSHSDIMVQARRVVREHGVKLIIVDFIQLISGPRGDGRNREIGMVAQTLKATAKALDIPIIALSQLSRRCVEEKREPELHDLRDSGEIEAHADVAIFIHHVNEEDGTAWLKVAKNRQLATGRVPVTWLPKTMRFVPRNT